MTGDGAGGGGPFEGGRYAVDGARCIGCAACSTLVPAVFRVERGRCRVLRVAGSTEDPHCRAAARNCPTLAIRGGDAEGAPGADEASGADAEAKDLFTELAHRAEAVRWTLADLPWSELDPTRAPPELRALVREMAFSENATYSATQRFLQTFYDDVAFSQWISVWFYEETKHPHVLMDWLARVGEPLGDDFVRRGRVSTPFMKSKMGTLVTNVISEMAAAHAYGVLASRSPEPVLAAIAGRIAGDEARHASSFYRFALERLGVSERSERERLDGLKVLHFWVAGRNQVSHPVNQMLQRVGAEAGGVDAPSFGFERLEGRVVAVVGALLGVRLSSAADVDAAVREAVMRVHHPG